MEKILFFVNEIPLDSIVKEFIEDKALDIQERRSRELLVRIQGPAAPKDRKTYLFCFTKSMSETLLKIRKKYFNLVCVDLRMKKRGDPASAVQNILEPFLERIDREPNVDKRYSFGRIMVLLDNSPQLPELVFELGRLQIGGYLIHPFREGRLIREMEKLFHRKRRTGKKALCLAGGGLEGLLYELGVLRALNSLFANYKVTDFDVMCGISAGAYISAVLANGIQPEEFIKAFEGESDSFDHITSSTIYDLNFEGYVSRWLSFWTDLAQNAKSTPNIFSSLIKAFPNGICKGEKLRYFLRKQLTRPDMTDDFRQLKKELYIGATNLDKFEHVVFGDDGWRDVPISTAVRASAAMEPIYSPAKIGNAWYIDGAYTKTTNFELAIKKGANLVIIVDPMVPIKTEQPGYVVRKGGIFSTIQGIKGLISTRFQRSYSFAKKQYSDVDFYVFKPSGEDMRLLSGSPMKYNIRLSIVARAYENTVKRILDDFEIFSKGFRKHGIELTKQEALEEKKSMSSKDLNKIKAILENSEAFKSKWVNKIDESNGRGTRLPLGLFS